MIWQLATRIFLPRVSPVDAPALFLNTATGLFEACLQPGPMPPPDVWQTLDLSPLGVPLDALAVDIRGFLIITDGSGTGAADLAVAYQKPGGTLTPAQYCLQTIATGPTGGSRSTQSAIVPCQNACIAWAWLRGDYYKGEFPGGPIPDYPVGATYALNMSVHAVYMP